MTSDEDGVRDAFTWTFPGRGITGVDFGTSVWDAWVACARGRASLRGVVVLDPVTLTPQTSEEFSADLISGGGGVADHLFMEKDASGLH